MGEKPLFGKIQIDQTSTPFGIIKIVEHPQSEGIQALLVTDQGELRIDKIYGSACGVSANLVQKGSKNGSDTKVFSGNMRVDVSQFAPYISHSFLSPLAAIPCGAGYAFDGEIAWSSDLKKRIRIHGDVTGKECELFGFTFDAVHAYLEANLDHVLLTQVSIEDAAGMLAIKQIAADKSRDAWEFAIPHLQVKEFRPSLLKRGQDATVHAKPFVIKNFTLCDIRGAVSDPMTWEGKGALNFTNAFKKETTLLDLPLELIKNFGLDPGLLTPIQGEVDVELHGDKFYLLNLKNAFSEGKRSQFFLSPETEISYIGLDGKLSIDLKMRQDVVLKLTEAFTLKVRGSVDRPRYGLHY
jgi:hypothetical protein